MGGQTGIRLDRGSPVRLAEGQPTPLFPHERTSLLKTECISTHTFRRGDRIAVRYLTLASLALIFLTGCTDATMSGISAYGQAHHIKQFSGGQLIGEWDSTGKVQNEAQSDGYYFEDAKTHKIVEVSGTVQITLN